MLSCWVAISIAGCGSGAAAGPDSQAGVGGSPGVGGSAGSPAAPRTKSNVCPDLLLLSCAEFDPSDAPPGVPPDARPGATSCEIRFRDDDNTCAQSCDPQICTPSPEGLACTPGPDPGVSTTVECPGALLDCTGDGNLDASCTMTIEMLASVPDLPDGPVSCVDAADCGVEGAACVGEFCDFSALTPTLNANFYVACDSASAVGEPVPDVVTCTAVTTDGDVECDKQATLEIACPPAE